MKQLSNILFVLITFQSFSQEKNVQTDTIELNNENFVYVNIVKNDAEIYEKPEFSAKVLATVSTGDSIKVFNYYKGKPLTKVLFWVTKINNHNAYILENNVQSKKLISFKNKVDSLNVEKNLLKEREQIELRNKSCKYEKNEKDEFNNRFEKFTILYEVAGYSLRLQLKKYDSELYVIAKSYQDLGCTSPYVNDRSFMKVKLMNNKILTFYHRGDLDCSGFRLFGRITNNEINLLKQSPIKSIRISGTEYYHDVENIDFNTFFIDKLKCVE